ncbi:MAG: class I SAM-dependent methyltransferase, partial [Anaerolineales bacterium]
MNKSLHEIEYEAWSQRADYYDSLFAPVSTQAVRDILNSLGEIGGKKHLDVACGTGHLVAAASKRGAISEGVDFAPAMVAAAQANYSGEYFQTADASDLPFEDGSFDVVTCSFGLLHMEKPQAAVDEAFRVLKSGGCFAFTLWYGAEDGNDHHAITKAALARHATKDVKLSKNWTQLRSANEQACQAITERAGFGNPVFKKLPIIWHITSGQEVIDLLLKLSVRTKMVIEQQPTAAQERIYQQILFEAEARRTNGFVHLKWPALLTVVQKPKLEGRTKSSSRLELKHSIFDSLEEILAPETLSELLSEPIASVDIQPSEDLGGLAGGQFSYVHTDTGRLILKQMSHASDWLMYASNDLQCRAVTLWQYGLL